MIITENVPLNKGQAGECLIYGEYMKPKPIMFLNFGNKKQPVSSYWKVEKLVRYLVYFIHIIILGLLFYLSIC